MKNLDLLRHVAADMDQLGVECIFFGGTVVGVHLDQLPPMEEERPTTDVDCVPLAIASHREMQKLEERMIAAGWKHDTRPHRQNLYARISPSGVPVDLVPMHSLSEEEPVRLGNSVEVEVGEGQRIRVLDSAGMVAAKLAAFHDRGSADPLMSHDLEDLAMLLSSCSTIEAALSVADTRLQNQVRTGLNGILEAPFVLEVLDGSIPRGIDRAQVMARLERLAK